MTLKSSEQFVRCPECGYGGGKYGHFYQLNPDNPNDFICGSCSHAWKILKTVEVNE